MLTTTPHATKPQRAPALRSYSVLLAEDDMLTADSIQRFLEEFNLNIVHARDGEEALELHARKPYDLVISDFEMPRRNGLDLLREIKARTPEQKIIFLTAHSENAILSDALQNGAAAYYLKPVDLKRLLVEVKELLGLNHNELVSRAHHPFRIQTGSVTLQHCSIDFKGCPQNFRLIDLIIGRLPQPDCDRSIISLRFDADFGLHKDALFMISALVDDLISLLHLEPADIDLSGDYFANLCLPAGALPGKLRHCRFI